MRPDSNLPDFVTFVRGHLPRGPVPAERYDDLVDDVASAPESRYLSLRSDGHSHEEAWRRTTREVPSWPMFVEGRPTR